MTLAGTLKYRLVTARQKTVTEVAEELGMSRPNFSNVIHGSIGLSVELAVKIEQTFGMDARTMLIQQLDEQLLAHCKSLRKK